MKENKKLQVSAIKDGTVIDHIPAKNLFKVIRILGLMNLENQVTFGTNLDSQKLGKKAIIKLSNKFFEDEEISKIILVAPKARLNIIKNYEVIDKKLVSVPDKIIGIAKCVNPKCVTNHEKVKTKFKVLSKSNVALKCLYCEKITDEEHIEIII
ncbi:MAG: aspartate carbamoyltransferase regulatory subunit [Bacteroidales bacterium]|nr:aspartate carbamoyltransferase regulatory subunit [Bacteroidales bacterium]MBN2758037.1 aspartate carbamoyltransferase regulatory subunit [Bacteroidales bacterium]